MIVFYSKRKNIRDSYAFLPAAYFLTKKRKICRMIQRFLTGFAVVAAISIAGCARKTVPTKTATVTPSEKNVSHTPMTPKPVPEAKKADTVTVAAATEKPVEKEKPKSDFPKVITVTDGAASKSVDGRLFYDVLGHRYWKNYKDGKYYLFDKSMYNNPDFRPSK